MQRISFLHAVSNHGPEKKGFWRIKKANPCDKIYPINL